MPEKSPEQIAQDRIAEAKRAGSTKLELSGIGLATLPPEIGKLTSLTILGLHSNQLSSLPPELGNLNNLTELLLGGNQLSSLPPEFGKLTNLTELYLHYNHFSSLPQEIGRLANLTELWLNDNQLSSLPPEIGKLNNLTRLYLGDNELSSLPAELGELENLEFFELYGNPLPEAITSAAERGVKELKTYLRSLAKARPLYEAKVLLVGEGGVGKTSVLASIKGEDFIEKRETTHGIELDRVVDVTPVKTPYPDLESDRELTLNFWDFGGQQVYRVTHQFFFSPDALYLLVWNPREGHRENAVEDWLERIRLRVGRAARVLIVATHRNDHIPELDFPALKARFGDMLVDPPAEVDNKDGRGIKELKRRVIELAGGLEHVGTPWAPSWHAAISDIRAREESHVPYASVAAICERHGLDANETHVLIGMMHCLGHLVYYDVERLRDFVVLDPEWLTKSIGYVLEDDATRADGGVLDHARLAEIWVKRDDTGEPYDPDDYPFFLRLMELYDVCYRIDERHSLVGQLVPYERPKLPWEVSTPTDLMQMSLACRMSADPPGLIAWMTVRNHRWATGKYWRGGVLLRHEDGNEALLELTAPTELSITVRGRWPSQFMGLLRDALERLLREEWQGLSYDLLVPCPGPDDAGGACPEKGLFSLRRLQEAVRRKVSEAQCHDCWHHLPISGLLLGHVPPSRPPIDLMEEMIALREEMIARFERIERISADEFARLRGQITESTRWVLRTLLAEAREGPRLFTLEPASKEGWDRLNIGEDKYNLTLWCEHPGHEHSCAPDGVYTIRQPKDWLVKVGPYVRMAARVLRMAAPIATGAVGVTELPFGGLPEDLKKRLDFMDKLTGALLKDKDEARELRVRDEDLGFSRVEGSALRAFHKLLEEQDKDGTRKWGGLRRVTNPSGDVLWVCPRHYREEYDRGLPTVPRRAASPRSTKA